MTSPELKAIAEAATPGPWELWTSNSWRRIGAINGNPVIEPTVQHPDNHPDLIISEADWAFIEAARTAIPALLDRLERIRELSQVISESTVFDEARVGKIIDLCEGEL